MDHPWWEYILRAGLIYAAVFLLLRIVGKKQIGEMGPFDLVLLLIVSEAVSNAITGGDDSMSAGLIAVTTFIVMNYLLDLVIFKSKTAAKVIDGEPKIVISGGRIIQKICDQEHITHDELLSTLREHNVDNLQDVDYAVLETNGQISVLTKKRPESQDPQASKTDLP